MRTPTFLKVLCQRGKRRRDAIEEFLNKTPGREWSESSITQMMHSWAGVIHPALVELHESGRIIRRTDGYGYVYYRSRLVDGQPQDGQPQDGEAQP